MQGYDIVYEGGSDEIVEKKSRFLAQVFPVHREAEATEYIAQIRKKYWDARHHCHAFVIGADNQISRCSDDGEPSGTAGRPILEVLTGAGVHDTLIVVTRYFGGTLLGTGGLVRAYSQAAQAGLAASRIVTKQYGRQFTIYTDYNGIGKLQYLTGQQGLDVLDISYTDVVVMQILVPEARVQQIQKAMTEATAGQAQIQISDPLFFGAPDGKPVLFS